VSAQPTEGPLVLRIHGEVSAQPTEGPLVLPIYGDVSAQPTEGPLVLPIHGEVSAQPTEGQGRRGIRPGRAAPLSVLGIRRLVRRRSLDSVGEFPLYFGKH
jgi:hypothetical protein